MQDVYEEKGEMKLEDYELVYQICDHPVFMTSPHYHSAVEIIYILEGEFVITVNETAYTMNPGEMVLINAKEVHSVNVLDYGIHRSLAVKFLPEMICSDSQSLIDFKYIIPYVMSFSGFKTHYTKEDVDNSDIKNCIDNIINEDRNREYAYKFATRTYISHLFLSLIRNSNIIIPADKKINDETKALFASIFQYISNNYADKLTSVQVAKRFRLRQSDFSAYFKKLTGKTFNEYLNYIRVGKAKRMLIRSEKNITEIAYSSGFTNPSYFIECFKKQIGTTPASFKQAYVDPSAKVYCNLKQNQKN